MRLALALIIIAACGSDNFELGSLPSCDTCGVGHVKAGVQTDAYVNFAADGARVTAYGRQHVVWLDDHLAITQTADTDLGTTQYGAGPDTGPVATAADGHGYAMVSGANRDGLGNTLTFYGLDSNGHPTWHARAVDDDVIPATWLFVAQSGDLIVASDTIGGASIELGGTTYRGWLVVATLARGDGSMIGARMYQASRAHVGGTVMMPDGGLLMVGTLEGHLNLGGAVGDLTTQDPGRTIFAARTAPDGDGVWAKTWTSAGSVFVDSVASDGTRVFASGTFTTSLDLGDGVTIDGGGAEISEYVAQLDATDGHTAWAVALPGNIGYPTVAPSPKGVLFGGSYLDATSIGGIDIPALVNPTGQAALCAELVDGHATWALTGTGNGQHVCNAVGTFGGHAYVAVGAADTTSPAHTDIDSISIDGQKRLLLEVGTAP